MSSIFCRIPDAHSPTATTPNFAVQDTARPACAMLRKEG